MTAMMLAGGMPDKGDTILVAKMAKKKCPGRDSSNRCFPKTERCPADFRATTHFHARR
jgi:hypothetical protein